MRIDLIPREFMIIKYGLHNTPDVHYKTVTQQTNGDLFFQMERTIFGMEVFEFKKDEREVTFSMLDFTQKLIPYLKQYS